MNFYDATEETRRREQKFNALLDSPNIDLNELKRLAWKGVPSSCRATVWKILVGYLPTSKDRRASVLSRKRQEFHDIVAQHFASRDPAHEATFRQVPSEWIESVLMLRYRLTFRGRVRARSFSSTRLCGCR